MKLAAPFRDTTSLKCVDRLSLTKSLIRASLFAQYRMSILLCGFNPNFSKNSFVPVFVLDPAYHRQLVGSSVPMGYPYALDLVSPNHVYLIVSTIISGYSQSVRYTASKSSIGLFNPMRAISSCLVTSARFLALNLEIRSPV